MLRFTRIHETPLTPAQETAAVRVRLTYDERVKHRLASMSIDSRAVAILLREARRGTALRDGTVLAGDGGFAIVEVAAEPVTRISADSPLALLRATYHLANRHVPAQLAADAVIIERDPILEAMLRGLGARIEHLEAPFDPEGGAYDGGHHHHGHAPRDEVDEVSATIGEQLSIAAHARGRRR
ncbi:MAG TPA: urease accessory protein UreE [Burkholderiaceae bacterium]|nr:urease accessory protein UreE [Burkholderiaceae bacterium]